MVAAPPAVTIDPSVIGTAVDGETVTADPGVWSGTAPVDFTYQWLRCDLDGTNCDADRRRHRRRVHADQRGRRPRHPRRGHRHQRRRLGDGHLAGRRRERAGAAEHRAADDLRRPRRRLDADRRRRHLDRHHAARLRLPVAALQRRRLELRRDPRRDGSTYTLTTDDVDHDVRVSVTATNSAGFAQATSAPGGGGAVQADPPVNTAVPTVSGTLEDGSTLIAGNGSWSGTLPIDFTYQWQRCDADGTDCEDIAGATSNTYTLTSRTWRHRARRRSPAPTTPATTSPTPRRPPRSTPRRRSSRRRRASPARPVDGSTLTADPGAYSGTGPFDFDYQWQRCDADGTDCVDIPGADESTYDLVSADVGGAIVVVVTATNDAGSDGATSAATGEVLPLAPANVDAAEHLRRPGRRRDADRRPRHLDRHAADRLHYQWQRCDADGTNCVDIVGADDPTYTVVPGDIDHVIQVVVTASNDGRQRRQRLDPDPDRRGRAAGQHGRPDGLGRPRGRLDADRDRRHLDRHRDDRLRLPVGALRARRLRLRGHRRRHRLDLRPDRRRRRQADPRRRHGQQRRRRGDRVLGAERRRGHRAARRDGRPRGHRHAGRRPDADRRPRRLDRHRADRLRLPVAALRRRRQQLRRHRRRHGRDLHARPRRRRRHRARRGHRRQRRADLGPLAGRRPDRRRAAGLRHRPDRVRHRRRRPHADRGRRHLERHRAAGLRLPVAALRRRRRELRRHRRRH